MAFSLSGNTGFSVKKMHYNGMGVGSARWLLPLDFLSLAVWAHFERSLVWLLKVGVPWYCEARGSMITWFLDGTIRHPKCAPPLTIRKRI
jgi:hypothetical protein